MAHGVVPYLGTDSVGEPFRNELSAVTANPAQNNRRDRPWSGTSGRQMPSRRWKKG